MQLCGSLSILWHCLSLGLEWKLTFSSPVTTAAFSKFAGILSAALSQHHLLGFEIAQLNSLTSTGFAHSDGFQRPTWLHIPGMWVITPLWLSGLWRSFLYSYSVYSCHLFIGSSKKQESSRKRSISALLTVPKPLTVWITINCGKFWKRWEYQTT